MELREHKYFVMEKMIWNWIKNLFKPKEQKDPHEEMFETNEYTAEQLQKMTKGILKNLELKVKSKVLHILLYIDSI